jgi:hypothetical protein
LNDDYQCRRQFCLALAAEFAGGKSREKHNESLRQRDEKTGNL